VKNKAIFAKVGWGLATGALIAISVSWFAGMVYREGSVLTPSAALVLATAIPFSSERKMSMMVRFPQVFFLLIPHLAQKLTEPVCPTMIL